MVGDGANDALAFQAADVGIAVQGAVDLSLKNADIALTRPGLLSLAEAFLLARSTMKLVRANFAFTLFYNLAAGILAATGHMSPLLAACLMPLSSLTVFAYTQWRTRRAE
jgi:P-type E1-E2 ATPase